MTARRCIVVVLILIALPVACTIGSPAPTARPSVIPLPSATPLPTLLPLLSPGWNGLQVTSLCLDVKHVFLNMDTFPQDLRQAKAREFARRLLSHLGFQVLEVGETCQAALTIELVSNATKATYTPGYSCFSGAMAEGRIQLTSTGLDPINVTVNEKSPPPKTISLSGCSESPVNAPFENVWFMAVLDGFQILWGPEVVLPAIDSPADLTEYRVDSAYVIDATYRLLKDHVELGKALLPILLDILSDPNRSHDNVASVLGWICQDAQAVIPALIAALQDPDAGTRAGAASSLGCFKAEALAAVPALASALADEDWMVRECAAISLGEIGPAAKSAVPALIQALNDEEELVRDRAAEALQIITGENFGNSPEAWQAWWENNK
jgi:hypothetical protein